MLHFIQEDEQQFHNLLECFYNQCIGKEEENEFYDFIVENCSLSFEEWLDFYEIETYNEIHHKEEISPLDFEEYYENLLTPEENFENYKEWLKKESDKE